MKNLVSALTPIVKDTFGVERIRGFSPAVRGGEGAERGELVIAYDLDFDM